MVCELMLHVLELILHGVGFDVAWCELMLHVLELILHGVEVDVTWLWELMLHDVGG